MPGSNKTTQDHGTIRRWAEERGGAPAVVKTTHGRGTNVGLLRFDFPGYTGSDTLEKISWEEFFQTFDNKHLEFLYQETTASGETSRFHKFVKAEH